MTATDRIDVEKLLDRKIKKHGGDARASLAEVTTDEVRHSLAENRDPDVRRSLAGLTPPLQGHVLVSTIGEVSETRERYTLTRLHASGGIGRVWLARDDSLGRDVALKELRPERAGQQSILVRFLKEAKITGQLEHPGIVPIYEVGRRPNEQTPFYTMRFVRGRTFAEAISRYHQKRVQGHAAPLDLCDLLTAFVGIGNAVAYAHLRGVLHRDLKPQNVVLGDYGEVIVLDWGLAKVVGEVEGDAAPLQLPEDDSDGRTMAGQVLGTPAYMSPEQAEGRLDLLDARTDVYALGAVLYQVLAGRPPFEGPDTTAVLRQVIQELPLPPRTFVAGVPRALDTVCLKALAKKPADRYESTKDLVDDVKHFLADEPVKAYREPLATRARRWSRRHRPLVAGVAAATAVSIVALVLSTAWLATANRKLEQANSAEKAAKQEALDQETKAKANFLLARESVNRYLKRIQ